MTQGHFITLEGIEGAGKSTLTRYLAQILSEYDLPVKVTREPGGTALGESIREILLKQDHLAMIPDAELLLLFAARIQHLHECILPALDAGNWVVCDRFTDASYAYQGGGRGIAYQRIQDLQTWVQGSFQPNFTVLLDLPVDLAMRRISARKHLDRFERESYPFFERIRQAYLNQVNLEPHRFCIIDASQSLGKVKQDLRQAVGILLKK